MSYGEAKEANHNLIERVCKVTVWFGELTDVIVAVVCPELSKVTSKEL